METFDVDVFDPNREALTLMAEEARGVTATDLFDGKQMAEVKKARIKLRDARITITKKGKEARDEANKFAKGVITMEKDLVALIAPEEERLKKLEEESANAILRRKREELLPERRKRLADLGDDAEEPDDHALNSMDEADFEAYVNNRVSAHNERERQKIEAEKRELERQKELKEAEERGRKEAEEAAAAEAERKKAAEVEEKKKLERKKKFREFLASHDITEETPKDDYKLVKFEGGYHVFKKVGTFNE